MYGPRDLASRLAALLAVEHQASGEFLVALAEFDRQRAWAALGHASLFWFLHRDLKLSKGAAHLRKVAAELLQEHPSILEPIADGRLCLSTVGELARVITAGNAAAVVPQFFHLSRREAAEVAAALRPVARPATRDLVTTVADGAPREEPVPGNRDTDVAVHPGERNARDESPRPAEPVPPSPRVIPLTEDLRRLHITVSRRFLALLDTARDALSHSHPGASTETILLAGLESLLKRHEKRRGIGAVAQVNPRRALPDRITTDVKRRVWARDDGRCQWPVEGGGVCGSTRRLEFDHRVPKGMGGPSDEANVRLLCRFHNQRAARLVYGDAHMDLFSSGPPAAGEPVASWARAPPSLFAGTWR
jgi:hypothetical protein